MKYLIALIVLFLSVGIGKAQKKEEKRYYTNGVLGVHGYYFTTKDGWPNKVGKWLEYYDTGKLKSIKFYNNNGVLDGEEKEFYENGTVKSIRDYSEGSVNGKERIFYESGKLKSSETFKKGVSQNGKKEYFKNGKEIILVKKALAKKIKNTNVEENFVRVDFSKEQQSVNLFTQPLKVEGFYFSGLRFKTTEEGYLYWNFNSNIGNSQIDNFYIVSVDPMGHDLEIKYFALMTSAFSTYKGNSSRWMVQKSTAKLKAKTEYIIYFQSKEVKPTPEEFVFELQLSPSDYDKLSVCCKII